MSDIRPDDRKDAAPVEARGVLSGGLLLFSAFVVRGVLALAASLMVAHILGKESFGGFVFLLSLYGFVSLVLDFGLPMASARLVALAPPAVGSELVGAYLVLAAPFAIVFLVLTVLGAGVIARLFGVVEPGVIAATALPCAGLFFHAPLRQLFTALGAHRLLIAVEIVPWVVFFILTSLAWLVMPKLGLVAVASLYGLSFAIGCLCVLLWASPRFQRVGAHSRDILAEVRRYGLNAYGGRTIGIVAYQFDASLLALLTHNPAWVAEYGLAKSLAAPVSLVASSLSTVMFRRFALLDRIPPWIVATNAGLMGAIALLGALVAPFVLPYVLPPGLGNVVPLTQIWLVTAAVGGISSLMSAWFDARGHGHVMRNVPIVYSLISVVAQVVLSPRYGAFGAAIAAFLSYFSSVFAYGWYYWRLARRVSA